MKRALVLLSLPLIAGCVADDTERPGGGHPSTTEASRRAIIGGGTSTDADHPTAGAMLSVGALGGFELGTLSCTGTLIAPDVVLTAAHCTINPLEGVGAWQYYFTFTLDVSTFGMNGPVVLPPRTYSIIERVPHPGFDPAALSGSIPPGLGNFEDVALLFLGEPVRDVTPMVLAEADDAPLVTVGSTVAIAGYGQRTPTDMSAGLKIHADALINEVNEAEMQIGIAPPSPQKCHGDSGGPTYLDIDDGLLPATRVIGITSRAYNAVDDCNIGGVDMRVDFFRDWIDQAMVDGCARGVRVFCAEGGIPRRPGPNGPIGPVDVPQPTPDAGVSVDAGPVDDGVADAGELDAGHTAPDAGSSADAGQPAADAAAGSRADGGAIERNESGGCRCTGRFGATSIALLAPVLLAAFRRRRRS